MASSNQKVVRCDGDAKIVATSLASAALGALGGWYVAQPKQEPSKDILVICGPSGVGKGTLIQLLTEEFGKSQVGFSVSHTTRNPRPGEVNGVHYHFVSKEEAEADIVAGKFVESAHVHTNVYGTSIKAVEDVVAMGKVCVLDIDVQGATLVKQSNLNSRAVYVFVKPPSMDELEKRLRGRGTETEEKVQGRLRVALDELKYLEKPDFWTAVFTNDDLKATSKDINAFVREQTKVR